MKTGKPVVGIQSSVQLVSSQFKVSSSFLKPARLAPALEPATPARGRVAAMGAIAGYGYGAQSKVGAEEKSQSILMWYFRSKC